MNKLLLMAMAVLLLQACSIETKPAAENATESSTLYTSVYTGWIPWHSYPEAEDMDYATSLEQFCLVADSGKRVAVTITAYDLELRQKGRCGDPKKTLAIPTSISLGNDALLCPEGASAADGVYLLLNSVSEKLLDAAQASGIDIGNRLNTTEEQMQRHYDNGSCVAAWKPFFPEEGIIVYSSEQMPKGNRITDLLVVYMPNGINQDDPFLKSLKAHWNGIFLKGSDHQQALRDVAAAIEIPITADGDRTTLIQAPI